MQILCINPKTDMVPSLAIPDLKEVNRQDSVTQTPNTTSAMTNDTTVGSSNNCTISRPGPLSSNSTPACKSLLFETCSELSSSARLPSCESTTNDKDVIAGPSVSVHSSKSHSTSTITSKSQANSKTESTLTSAQTEISTTIPSISTNTASNVIASCLSSTTGTFHSRRSTGSQSQVTDKVQDVDKGSAEKYLYIANDNGIAFSENGNQEQNENYAFVHELIDNEQEILSDQNRIDEKAHHSIHPNFPTTSGAQLITCNDREQICNTQNAPVPLSSNRIDERVPTNRGVDIDRESEISASSSGSSIDIDLQERWSTANSNRTPIRNAARFPRTNRISTENLNSRLPGSDGSGDMPVPVENNVVNVYFLDARAIDVLDNNESRSVSLASSSNLTDNTVETNSSHASMCEERPNVISVTVASLSPSFNIPRTVIAAPVVDSSPPTPSSSSFSYIDSSKNI